MIFLISNEWRDTSSNTKSIVVRKICKQQEFRPVFLLVITIYTEILLKCLVHIFGLSITFGIIT